MNNSAQKPTFRERYENFIGGKWVAPVKGKYFENVSPIDGKVFTYAARSTQEDIELALDAAWDAFPKWSKTSVTERSNILLKIADIVEKNLSYLATVETIDNGKPIRETTLADLPLVVDHFRYFAGVIRGEESTIAELDEHTVSMNIHEPIGVVGQIIPWNFPLLMATWKVAPALAAGCCVIVKPAEQTPTSIMCLLELIQDLLPAGVLNVVTGFGVEAGKPLASSPRISKVAFTGETTTGRLIMQYASENIIPVTMELGGKSPNIFFQSVMDEDDDFLDKCVEGAVMFALNQGEICTCPSRILVHESIADAFIEKLIGRINAIKQGNPLDMETMIGAQASNDQYEKILSYLQIGKEEGAEVLTGGAACGHSGDLSTGYYIQPTLLKGHNKMRVFQEEIFGPVTSLTTFKTVEEAIEIANDTLDGISFHEGKRISYTNPEIKSEYADGGLKGWGSFLNANLSYPQDAREKNIEGKVYINFVVCTDGSLCNFEVIKSSGNSSLDEEALRVVKLSNGKWKPGLQRGKLVKTKYVLPLNFILGK